MNDSFIRAFEALAQSIALIIEVIEPELDKAPSSLTQEQARLRGKLFQARSQAQSAMQSAREAARAMQRY